MADRDKDASSSRGRPRSPEPSATVSCWLPASEHDKLIDLAKKSESSVSQVVRRILRGTLDDR